ncbi:MAG: GDP-mannose 4,6-dehydratase, partial [Clostridiales bacterium]
YKTGKKFLQVSTDEVYGSLGDTGFFTENTPLDPHSPYSASKTSADLFVKAYFDTYKFPINITRCSNNYGPYQFPEKLIPLMINNVLKGAQLPIYGDGMQIRDWLYVDDHCKAIDLVLEGGIVGEIYNIGGHNERPNIVIVKTILDYIKNNVDPKVGEHLIKYVEDRKGHDRRYGIDPQKIKDDLGINKTIEWYLKNPSWIANVTSGEYQNYYNKMYLNK